MEHKHKGKITELLKRSVFKVNLVEFGNVRFSTNLTDFSVEASAFIYIGSHDTQPSLTTSRMVIKLAWTMTTTLFQQHRDRSFLPFTSEKSSQFNQPPLFLWLERPSNVWTRVQELQIISAAWHGLYPVIWLASCARLSSFWSIASRGTKTLLIYINTAKYLLEYCKGKLVL